MTLRPNPATIRKAVTEGMSIDFEQHGFRVLKSKSEFIKETSEARLEYLIITNNYASYIQIDPLVMITFKGIFFSDRNTNEIPGSKPVKTKFYPCFSCRIVNYAKFLGREMQSMDVYDADSLSSSIEMQKKYLCEFALPWFERYSNMNDVLNILLMNDEETRMLDGINYGRFLNILLISKKLDRVSESIPQLKLIIRHMKKVKDLMITELKGKLIASSDVIGSDVIDQLMKEFDT